jgi:hypothetical protein
MKLLSSSIVTLAVSTTQGAPVPGGTLDPLLIPKFVEDLVIPPVLYDSKGEYVTFNVALRQFEQQVLPSTGCKAAQKQDSGIVCISDAFKPTILWGYGNPMKPDTFFNPSFTIEVTKDKKTRVKWINELTDKNNKFLPHIIQDANGDPVIDQTLHWAAPNGVCANGELKQDCRGNSGEPYYGPVPMVIHVHGSHVGPGSDVSSSEE